MATGEKMSDNIWSNNFAANNNSYAGSVSSEYEHKEDSGVGEQLQPTFFSDLSLCEFAFGIGSLGVNCLSFGMMLNIPTLTLHKLMYAISPKGLLHAHTTDQERISVCKSILDYWMEMTKHLTNKIRFRRLQNVFKVLGEKEIAEALKTKFEANEPVALEMFYKFDLGRLGPYVPPPVVESDPQSFGEDGSIEDDNGSIGDGKGSSVDDNDNISEG